MQNRFEKNILHSELTLVPNGMKQVQLTVPEVLTAGEWCHVASVSGPGGLKLYLNGVLVTQDPTDWSFAAVVAEATLGSSSASRAKPRTALSRVLAPGLLFVIVFMMFTSCFVVLCSVSPLNLSSSKNESLLALCRTRVRQ